MTATGRRVAPSPGLRPARKGVHAHTRAQPGRTQRVGSGAVDGASGQLGRACHPLAVLLLDIDSFKAVNDTHGHLQGDRLLRAFAELLQHGTRASDALGRHGGDEFVILLADTERAEAETIAARLVGQIARCGQALFADTPTSASCGVALARPGEDSAAVLERADAAAYQVKSRGGNGVAVAP